MTLIDRYLIRSEQIQLVGQIRRMVYDLKDLTEKLTTSEGNPHLIDPPQ